LQAGDFRVNGAGVEKRIESNKLRLVYQRRPCADLLDTVCSEPDPPTADFPNGWGGFADMMHVDFKIPAEHRIYGEVFDAEMQIFHLHPGRERLPAISVLIRVDPLSYNPYLQMAIDAFQFEYDKHKGQCADQVRRSRKMVSDFQSELMGASAMLLNSTTLFEHHEHWAEFSTDLDNPEFLKEGEEHTRRMQSRIWHPYHEDLIPTYWFYGYDGSLTEPPCSEIVSWFVMDTPMLISPGQLEQMKTILFTHVDENCQGTSAHFQESVARPIQESVGREIWRCSRDDFPPDSERSN
jgi:carbonic anhydrase